VIILFVIGSCVFGLSFIKPSNELTEKDVLRIKKRYAQLEINKPKKEEEEHKPEKEEKGSGKAVGKKAKPKIDRSRESREQREQRKMEGSQSRAKVREALKQEIEQVGLFAELTALGGEGEEGEIDDVLAQGEIADLGGINLSSTGFTARPTAKKMPKDRKGSRIASNGIGRQRIEKARAKKIQVSADIQMAAPSNIEGAALGEASRTASSIREVILRIQNKIKLQFEKYLRQDPSLAGKVEIEFVIKADGSVSDVRITKNTLGHPAFERRLLSMMRRLRFAPATADIIVAWPFIFAASET
jgi:TonB family protein